MNTYKLNRDYQEKFSSNLLYDSAVLNNIDPKAKLHDEAKSHPLSSAAACMNVLGAMSNKPEELKRFLNSFGLNISKLYPFPSGADIGGLIYNDQGYVVFEWIGPQKSPINETGGGRGQNRTSVDAFIIAEIDDKITQLMVEWKFTEGLSREFVLEKFAGHRGIERLYRYSQILKPLRNKGDFPFKFKDEKGLGLYDFAADHLYQLFRITLLAKTTTPINIDSINVEDYRVVHLTHSQNPETEILQEKHLTHSPGMAKLAGMKLHEAWEEILSDYEKKKFVGAYWDTALKGINDDPLREYLVERYG